MVGPPGSPALLFISLLAIQMTFVLTFLCEFLLSLKKYES